MSKFLPENAMWTEKFRPRKISDMVGDFKEKILEHLKNPMSVPHFLFYSKAPGTGKSTLMKAIINELGCDALIINSSDERKIETIRERVKEFAMTKSSKEGIKRCVALDEVDGMCLPFGTEIFKGTIRFPNIKKIEDVTTNHSTNIPSVNINTGKIENDKGILVDSGIADFFEIELEDGRKIVASYNHPFFKENFVETKLRDLKVGDKIIDYSDEIYKDCPICKKKILKSSKTCSMECKNKLHSKEQKGEGNSYFGKVQSEETKKLISKANKGRIEPDWKRKKQSMFMKENNPMNNIENRKKISEKNKGRIFSESWKEKLRQSKDTGFGTEKYEVYCKEKNKIISLGHQVIKRKKEKTCVCQICNKELLTSNWCKGLIIHHINRDREDNSNKNLLNLCSKCHNYIHRGSKFSTHKEWHSNWKEQYNDKLKEFDVVLYGEKNEIS